MAIGPVQMYDLGFHPSAVAGCFGAAAAAAFLLRLEREAVVRALGLAACQASGLMAWQSDPSENARPFQMGMAARNGVTAALLAAAGFGGPDAVFDHGHTVFRAFSRGPRPELLIAGLGERWDGVMELAIKPYASVSFLHPALDALLALVHEHDLRPDDIDRLTLRFPRAGVHCVDGNPLKSHCAQYILPIAVAAREVAVADLFEDRRQSDAQVAALALRTEVVADDALDALFPNAYASIIEIRTADGRTLERRNDIARGYPETPLGDEELAKKFRQLAGSVAAPERVAALEGALATLPKRARSTRWRRCFARSQTLAIRLHRDGAGGAVDAQVLAVREGGQHVLARLTHDRDAAQDRALDDGGVGQRAGDQGDRVGAVLVELVEEAPGAGRAHAAGKNQHGAAEPAAFDARIRRRRSRRS